MRSRERRACSERISMDGRWVSNRVNTSSSFHKAPNPPSTLALKGFSCASTMDPEPIASNNAGFVPPTLWPCR